MTHAMDFAGLVASPVSRGVDLNLVEELFATRNVKSPMLLLSRSAVQRNIDALASALPRAEIHYAIKSNNQTAILKELLARGSRFDVCSAREIDDVLNIGGNPSDCLHSHPIKSTAEFDQAVAKGIDLFVVDNVAEIEKLTRYRDKKLRILIRYRVHTNTTAVVNLQYKFGCTVKEVVPLAEKVRESGHEFYGLCFHIGSQCVYTDNYLKAIRAAQQLIRRLDARGFNTAMLDIGGGFPVEYVTPVPEIAEFCKPINTALKERIRPGIRIVCEPGRFISASPVTLVSSIIGKSVRDGKVWYYLDDGLYSTFSGIVFDHCQYPVVSHGTGQARLSVLAGPTCDSFDVMYDGLMIPEQQVGDILVFPLTGAYCAVSGSDFNSLTKASYQVID